MTAATTTTGIRRLTYMTDPGEPLEVASSVLRSAVRQRVWVTDTGIDPAWIKPNPLCSCTIDLLEEGGHRYRVRQPAENPWGNERLGEHDPVAEAELASDGAGGPRFSGVLVCRWFDGYRPGEADSALLGLLVDHTTALVEHERLTARVDELRTSPENAALLLPSHQRVAAAVGILMVLHHLTAAQATDLLTRASQHTHLSIRGVADTVLRTGAMPAHPHPAATPG